MRIVMLRNFFLVCFVLSGAVQASVESMFEAYTEVLKRQETLQWLGDTRTSELRAKLLADLDPKTRLSIEKNTAGSDRQKVLKNYHLRKQELMGHMLAELKEWPEDAKLLRPYLKTLPGPFSPAHHELVDGLQKGLKFAALQNPELKDAARMVAQSAGVLPRLKPQQTFEKIDKYYRLRELYDIPIWWFDDRNYSILYETSIAKTGLQKIELNSASREELMGLPGVSNSTVDRILQMQGEFTNVRELIQLAGLSEEKFHELQPFVHVDNRHEGVKKWTLLVYICASNDLERFGVLDVNEMERVGSDENLNIVVQLDRIHAKKRDQQYQDFVGDGNWEKTRRYYVTKDENPDRIESQLIEEMGQVDMGDPGELYEFMKYGVDHYPAENYMVVIWNHGAGWPGIAYDDQSGNHLSIERLSSAFAKMDQYLERTQQKDGIDIVNMDACLMAMAEVAYELKGHVHYLVGSQELEPGAGMPYADYLAPLKSYPDMSPRALSRNMVDKFVRSYTTRGSQASNYWGGSAVTQSAIDVRRIGPVVEAMDQLAGAFLENPQWWEAMLQGHAHGVYGGKRYATKSFADLYDFTRMILANQDLGLKLSPSIVQAARKLQKALGVPKGRRETDYTVRLTLEQPGFLVWGVDGWKTPSSDAWPRGTTLYRSRFAKSPLKKEKEGHYAIEFNPFQRMKDRATQKPFFPQDLNYRFVDLKGNPVLLSGDRRENTITSKSEYRITQHFPKTSPIVIEGHTQGMRHSHGLSVYLPFSATEFEMPYRNLRLAQDTRWDELLMLQPEFERRNSILIGGGIADAPQPVRQAILGSLDDAGVGYDLIANPKAYQGGMAEILARYENGGVFITTRPSSGLSLRNLKAFMRRGGKLVLLSTSMVARVQYQDFLQTWFGVGFGGTIERETRIGEELYGTELSGLSMANGQRVHLDLAGTSWLKSKGAEGLIEDQNERLFVSSHESSNVYIAAPIWRMLPAQQTALMQEVLNSIDVK